MDHFVVKRRGCIAQRLPDILRLEERVFRQNCAQIPMGRQQLENPPDGDAHPANARLTTAFARLDGDSVKGLNCCHYASLT